MRDESRPHNRPPASCDSLSNHLDKPGFTSYATCVGSLVDYDIHYKKGRGQCGSPFPAVEAALQAMPAPGRVLDLGCGQGRDVLLAAQLGHEVVGVDLSEVGIAQMLEDAKGLNVTGVVSDVLAYRSRRKFDVVVLDRVLHLLLDDDERRQGLERAAALTKKGGTVLVADTPKHAALIQGFFDAQPTTWKSTKRTKNFLFATKL